MTHKSPNSYDSQITSPMTSIILNLKTVPFDLEKAFDQSLLWKLLQFYLTDSYLQYNVCFFLPDALHLSISLSMILVRSLYFSTQVYHKALLSLLYYLYSCTDLRTLRPNIHFYQYADESAFLALPEASNRPKMQAIVFPSPKTTLIGSTEPIKPST